MSFWGRSWWVVVFCSFTLLVYLPASKEKKGVIQTLRSRLETMEKERFLALQKREDLELRIASQNDPAWIEIILMRDLGVVPEGFLKVHFKK